MSHRPTTANCGTGSFTLSPQNPPTPPRRFEDIAAEFEELYLQYHQSGLQELEKGITLRHNIDTSCLEPVRQKFSPTMTDYANCMERFLSEPRSMAPWSTELSTFAVCAAGDGK